MFANDARLAARLMKHLGVPCLESPLVNEGGAFSVDGCGTVLTTKSVLLNENRNPHISRAEAEKLLCALLGVRKVIWLPGSTVDSITDGHVDGIAVFAEPGVVLAELTSDRRDPEYAILRENLRVLQLATDAHGRKLEILNA